MALLLERASAMREAARHHTKQIEVGTPASYMQREADARAAEDALLAELEAEEAEAAAKKKAKKKTKAKKGKDNVAAAVTSMTVAMERVSFEDVDVREKKSVEGAGEGEEGKQTEKTTR